MTLRFVLIDLVEQNYHKLSYCIYIISSHFLERIKMNRICSTLALATRTFNLGSNNLFGKFLGNGCPFLAKNTIDTLQIRCAQFGREYQPNNLQRKRKHGYLKRKRTEAGRKILEARKAKGRKWLSH